jgi:hypothetical protein
MKIVGMHSGTREVSNCTHPRKQTNRILKAEEKRTKSRQTKQRTNSSRKQTGHKKQMYKAAIAKKKTHEQLRHVVWVGVNPSTCVGHGLKCEPAIGANVPCRDSHGASESSDDARLVPAARVTLNWGGCSVSVGSIQRQPTSLKRVEHLISVSCRPSSGQDRTHSLVRLQERTDAEYNPRDQWDEHLSEGRSGTSLWPCEPSDSKHKRTRKQERTQADDGVHKFL